VQDNLLEWLPEHRESLRVFEHCAESYRTGPDIDHAPKTPLAFRPGATFENEGDVGETRKKAIFRELCKLIEHCGADSKLVFVLDHLVTGLSDEARDDYILPRLVQPPLNATDSGVVVVAVLPKDYRLPLQVPGSPAALMEVPQRFEKSAFELLLREYLARNQSSIVPPEQKARVRTLAQMGQNWGVGDLVMLGQVAGMRADGP